jgi:hypothetical protein
LKLTYDGLEIVDQKKPFSPHQAQTLKQVAGEIPRPRSIARSPMVCNIDKEPEALEVEGPVVLIWMSVDHVSEKGIVEQPDGWGGPVRLERTVFVFRARSLARSAGYRLECEWPIDEQLPLDVALLI